MIQIVLFKYKNIYDRLQVSVITTSSHSETVISRMPEKGQELHTPAVWPVQQVRDSDLFTWIVITEY